MALKPIRSTTLKQQVVESLRKAIFDGTLPLGESLRELHLARDLKVSQPTIREALLELEKEGLVVRTPNVGTAVTNMTSRELAERLTVRAELETMACVLAAQQMGEAEFAELHWLLDKLGQTTAANNYHESAQADLEFHRYIWRCSGNEILAQTLDRITAPLFAFVSVLRSASLDELKRTVCTHTPMLQALRRGDPREIQEAVRGVIGDSYQQFLNSGMEDCRAFAQATRRAPPVTGSVRREDAVMR